jgi:Flp pilus assembly protein TadG
VPGGRLLATARRTVRRAARRTARRPARSGDRGSVAVFTAVFAFVVLLLLGLLVDGGDALNARERAADIAEQAARAAVTDLSIGDLHSQGTAGAETVAIDWTTACTFAQQTVTDYTSGLGGVTAAAMAKCGEGANPLTATVTVTVTSRPAIPVPGFENSVTMTVTQSATAECGNADQQEVC